MDDEDIGTRPMRMSKVSTGTTTQLPAVVRLDSTARACRDRAHFFQRRTAEIAAEERKWEMLKRASARLRKRYTVAETKDIRTDKKNPFCVEKRIMDRQCLLESNKNPSLRKTQEGGRGAAGSSGGGGAFSTSSSNTASAFGAAPVPEGGHTMSSMFHVAKNIYGSRASKRKERRKRKVVRRRLRETERGEGGGASVEGSLRRYGSSVRHNRNSSSSSVGISGPSFGHRPNSASRIFDPLSSSVEGSGSVVRSKRTNVGARKILGDRKHLSGLLTAADLEQLLSTAPQSCEKRRAPRATERRKLAARAQPKADKDPDVRAKEEAYNNRLHLLPRENCKTRKIWGYKEKAKISTQKRIERFESRAVEGRYADAYFDLEAEGAGDSSEDELLGEESRRRFDTLEPVTSSFVTKRWHAVPEAITHREVQNILRRLDDDQRRVEQSKGE